jgi:hypothetical protein
MKGWHPMVKQMWHLPSDERPCFDGIRHIYRFEGSEYIASVVRHQYSYGGPEGLWELAILYDGKIVSTPVITDGDDVIGWLTDDDVQALLVKVDALQDGEQQEAYQGS